MTTGSRTRPMSLVLRALLAPSHLLERAKGRWRLALLVAYTVVAAVAVGLVYRSTRLIGLPDIPVPAADEAEASRKVPDERNAFVLFAEALRVLDNTALREEWEGGAFRVDPEAGWSKQVPPARRWAEANREALERWREGSERPDAVRRPEDLGSNGADVVMGSFSTFTTLALLEAARREEMNDPASAWPYYRAVTRAARLLGRRGTILDRHAANEVQAKALAAVTRWAADPRVDADALRRALADAKALEAITPLDRETLQPRAREVARDLEFIGTGFRPDAPESGDSEWRTLWEWTGVRGLRWVGDVLNREPERSRRLVNLTFANWLSAVAPDSSRPAPSRRVVVNQSWQTQSLALFPADPEAVASGQALPADELARWLAGSPLAQEVLANEWFFYNQTRAREIATRGELSLMLAEQLYLREHGAPPPTADALVEAGYLEALPLGDVEPAEAVTARSEAGLNP